MVILNKGKQFLSLVLNKVQSCEVTRIFYLLMCLTTALLKWLNVLQPPVVSSARQEIKQRTKQTLGLCCLCTAGDMRVCSICISVCLYFY